MSSGAGTFTEYGYKFWTPEELGGWAMVEGDTQAVAMVFGKNSYGPGGTSGPRAVFNNQNYGTVLTLMPAVEVTWPNYRVLTQYLAIVPGTPSDVPSRAANIAPSIQAPVLTY